MLIGKFIFFCCVLSLAGCYSTATRSEMDAKVAAIQSHKYPVTLRLEKSDDKYDYYKAVDYFGTLGMYKVRRSGPDDGKKGHPDIQNNP